MSPFLWLIRELTGDKLISPRLENMVASIQTAPRPQLVDRYCALSNSVRGRDTDDDDQKISLALPEMSLIQKKLMIPSFPVTRTVFKKSLENYKILLHRPHLCRRT